MRSESQTCVHLAPPPNEMYFNVEPHCRTSIPGSRYGHTVCSYKDRIYMYGGRNDEDGSFSKVDCYDISKSKGSTLPVTSSQYFFVGEGVWGLGRGIAMLS